jgi:nucleotide-binding universal stress UspA family protein
MPDRNAFQKILVPLDFSEYSRRALDYALRIARGTGSRLVLLAVIDDRFPYPELFVVDNPNVEYYREMRRRALDRMDELLGSDPGVPVEKVVVKGRPRSEIPAMAEEVGADLIVIARHGTGALRAAIMGSTAESVVREARCPVLVLPSEAEK